MQFCFFIHKWELRIQKGVYDYFECSKCGTRKYKHERTVIEWVDCLSINWDWLMDCPNPQYINWHGPH